MKASKKNGLIPVLVGLLLSPGWACGGIAYDEASRTLVADIDSEDTLKEEQAACLTGNLATNFVKKGTGLLTVSLDLSAYLGDIHVDEGAYRFVVNTALGKLDGEDVCGSVYVKSGATLDACNAEANAWTWWNKRIVFAGDGAQGWGGALTWSAEKDLSRMVFSSNLVMTADATINNRTTRYLYMSGGSYPVWLNMNGNTLTCKGKGNNSLISWGCLNVKNPGHIVVDGVQMSLQNNNTYLNGDASNTISFANDGRLGFNRTSGGGNDWTLDARNLGGLFLAAGDVDRPDQSYWSGSVLLGDKDLSMSLSKYHYSFYGTISGCGLKVTGDQAVNSHLHLHSADNSFTNGVTAHNSVVHLHADGALPADGARLSLKNGGVSLERADVNYQLPPLEVDGSATVTGVQGKWRESVTKNGAGTLVWKSATGSDVLDVREGTVEILEDRTPIAGLMEGGRTYDKQNKLWNSWDPTKITTTNCTLGTEAFYTQYHRFWYDPLEFEDGKYDRYIVAYRGYVWNNSPTNETWSFAGACMTHLTVSVNGESVFFYTGAGSTCRGNAVLHPGANSIEVREYTSITYCPFIVVPEIPDWSRYAFCVGYDPQGRGSTSYADYQKLLDPGDGSLFTWVDPKDIVDGQTTVPGTTRTVTSTIPTFKRMKFAKGTVAKFSFLDYAVEALEGLPEVQGLSDSLTVTTEWKVDAADIVAGARLTVPGKLVFGDQTRLTLTDLTKAMRGQSVTTFTIAVADGGIEGAPVLAEECEGRWKVRVDGNAVKVTYFKPGAMLVVR